MSKIKERYTQAIKKVAEIGKIPRDEWTTTIEADFRMALLIIDVFADEVSEQDFERMKLDIDMETKTDE